MEVASPSPLSTPFKRINPVLPEETIRAFTEAVCLQDNAESPQDLPLPPLFASRPITRHKFQQTPQGEVQSVIHKELYYTAKELLVFSNL